MLLTNDNLLLQLSHLFSSGVFMKSIPERMTIPQLIVYVSKFMFENDLTDIAGGNISTGILIQMTS
jgi:hypothetical protein